jgi:DNA-binding beta-propeller fold protein YncE
MPEAPGQAVPSVRGNRTTVEGQVLDAEIRIRLTANRAGLESKRHEGVIEIEVLDPKGARVVPQDKVIPLTIDVLPALTIQVKDARTNAPVEGATVRLDGSGLNPATTAADGTVVYPSVKVSDGAAFTLTIAADNYIDLRGEAFSVPPYEITRSLKPVPRFIKSFRGPDFGLHSIAVSTDGRTAYLTSPGKNSLLAFDVENGDVKRIDVGKQPTGVAVNPVNGEIYVANKGQAGVDIETVSVVGPELVVRAQINVGNGPVALAVTHDGETLYVANRFDRTISVINLAINAPDRAAIPIESEPTALALSPDNRWLYVAHEGSNFVTRLDTQTAETQPLDVGSPQAAITVGEQGEVYIAHPDADKVTVRRPAPDNTLNTTIQVGRPIRLGIGTTDGGLLYALNASDETVSIVDLETGAVTEEQLKIRENGGESPQDIAVTADGGRVYVANGNGTVLVFGVE